MAKTVTAEYLAGIREGREYLNSHKPDVQEMALILANVRETAKRFSAGPVKDILKGERDFWINQIKKAGN